MDAFVSLNETLAGFGHSLEARTRLTFGPQVAKALAGIESGGFVIVATQGMSDEDIASYNALINEHVTHAALVDARTSQYSAVRPHVASYVKTRKLAASVTPPRKDEDGNPIGFIVRKSA